MKWAKDFERSLKFQTPRQPFWHLREVPLNTDLFLVCIWAWFSIRLIEWDVHSQEGLSFVFWSNIFCKPSWNMFCFSHRNLFFSITPNCNYHDYNSRSSRCCLRQTRIRCAVSFLLKSDHFSKSFRACTATESGQILLPYKEITQNLGTLNDL